MFLKHPSIIVSKDVPVYFMRQAVSKADKQSVEDLVLHLAGKKVKSITKVS